MMLERLHAWLLCAALALFPALAAAQSPIKAFPPGMFQNRAAIDAAPVVGYQGPGDVSPTGWVEWGSCAYVFQASLASTSTSLCDLVSSSAPTVVLCTLRGTSTGAVDLTAYCAGALTPAVTCAAATGAKCNISKVYGQVAGNNWVSTTAATQPVLTFSAVNGLPGMTGIAANTTFIGTVSNVTQAQPFTQVAVYERTGSFTSFGPAFGSSSSSVFIGGSALANQGCLFSSANGCVTAQAANDNSPHAILGVSNGASSITNIDGNEGTGTQSAAISAEQLRFLRTPGTSITGFVMEGGLASLNPNSGLRSALISNMRTRYAF